jgi:cytochrome c-type biogenesis protein CcmH/NrfF
LPALLAFSGFVYVLVMRPKSLSSIWFAVMLILIGTVIYMLRARRRHEWPFGNPTQPVEISAD